MDLKDTYDRLIRSVCLHEVKEIVSQRPDILSYCPSGGDLFHNNNVDDVGGIPLQKFINKKTDAYNINTASFVSTLTLQEKKRILHEYDNIIIYLIEEGAKNQIGSSGGDCGTDGRGGLIMAKCRGWKPFQILVVGGHIEILRHLTKMNPPLLKPNDVVTYELLDLSITNNSSTSISGTDNKTAIGMIKFLLELNPAAVYGTKSCQGLSPILRCTLHSTDESLYSLLPLLLSIGLKHQMGDTSIGGLCLPGPGGITPLDVLFKRHHNFSSENDLMKIVRKTIKTQPIFQVIIRNYAHSGYIYHKSSIPLKHYLRKVMIHFHYSIRTRDDYGRLPIHTGIALCIKWDGGMKEILDLDKNALVQNDPVTNLSPVALAASTPGTDLSLVYELCRQFPQHCVM
jgi:hypothetical protein